MSWRSRFDDRADGGPSSKPRPGGEPAGSHARRLGAPPGSLPNREAFVGLARQHRLVPVWCELVADTLTPVGTFLRVVGGEPGFLLESVEGGERWGRYSFVGRRPLGRVVTRTGEPTRATGAAAGVVDGAGGALAAVESLLAAFRSPSLPELPPLHGGLVGYLGYDVAREVERLENPPEDDRGLPDAVLTIIGQLCVFDHWRQRVVLVHNVLLPDDAGEVAGDADQVAGAAYDAACRALGELAEEVCQPLADHPRVLPAAEPDGGPVVTSVLGSQEFRLAVAAAKEHISAGDVFQVVLSRRFDFELGADPFEVYRVLRLVNPSPYLYFLRDEAVTVVGASPEPMVRLRDGVVTSRPIAGSRPRGSDDTADRRLAGELAEDPKEVAEHVMLVDLARNDVGRVAEPGTMSVDELMVVERYSHIMHLTSQVSGRLRPGLGPVDVLRATLPAGTLSGAPKVRAMEIIDELEPTRRSVYGGVVGYIDFSGNLDTAIAIRTMVVAPDGRASVQAGAGIVADSDPEREDDEAGAKAAAVLSAVARARAMARERASR
ncbi:MAG: anthranilate synthase component I [Actinomycetota bacterium]|nr:anthranilate synthase component I [Actinomycetota bacterium]